MKSLEYENLGTCMKVSEIFAVSFGKIPYWVSEVC